MARTPFPLKRRPQVLPVSGGGLGVSGSNGCTRQVKHYPILILEKKAKG
jgi:hypothetical protein